MKLLSPIKDKDAYSDSIFEYIAKQMYQAMYAPLFRILARKPEQTLLSNAMDKSNLKSALLSGKVWYSNDSFYGDFNSIIGKELRALGARFNSLTKTYFIKLSDIPMPVRAVISESTSKFKAQQTALTDTLNKMNNPPQIEFKEILPKLNYVFMDLGKQFTSTVPHDLAIPMEMTNVMKEAIAQDYTYNLNIYIKDWYVKDIVKLREIVEESVAQGYRAEFMEHVLQAQYGVASRKASFLAKQETSLLVSKYRQTRYTEAGLTKYKWSTSADERVRPDHKVLDGKIFDWDHPPITNRSTGARNNPGEDFGPCRCVAIPLIS